MALRRPRRIRPPVEALADGFFALNLSDEEAEFLVGLLHQMRDLLLHGETEDQRLRRLFPVAYHQDPERDAEYQRLMREDLVASRLSGIEAMEAVLAPERRARLDAEDVAQFMQAINGLRLVLGTLLDVSEEDDPTAVSEDDPLVAEYHLYAWLSWLLEFTVVALSARLGPDGT